MWSWAAYEKSLCRRGDITVWFDEEAIAAWNAAASGLPGGHQEYSDLAIGTSPALRSVFHLALRQPEGFVGSLIRLMGIGLTVPDHTALSRRGQSLKVPPMVREHDGPLHLVIDSTGDEVLHRAPQTVELPHSNEAHLPGTHIVEQPVQGGTPITRSRDAFVDVGARHSPATPGSLGLELIDLQPDTLVVSIDTASTDADSGPSAISYDQAWTRDGAPQTAYAGLDTVPSSATTRDESWEVTVIATDGQAFSAPATGSMTFWSGPTKSTAAALRSARST